MRATAGIACWLLAAAAAAGNIAYCPRVVSPHNADTTDLRRFRSFGAWKDRTGNDLAIAIWQYLCDYETGLYHFYEVQDGADPFAEFATMREPLKLLNVYNMAFCGSFGPTVEGIFHGCGFEGRSFGLPAWSHCATEIFYDGGWHYFDVDVRGALVRPDGVVASLEEARKDRRLWVDSIGRIKPFFPHHGTPQEIARVADIYARSSVDYQYRWFQGSHTADYVLRPGESFTRWWQPQGGRWNHRPSYNREQWVRKLLLAPPRGMKPNHREFSRWNHGNGLFRYAPDLRAPSRDVQAGAYALSNLAPGADGLTLAAEAGEVVFAVFTPFVIVPRVNDLDDTADDAEASVITLDAAAGVETAISLDNGLSWREAARADGGRQAIDLTKQVSGTYGYLARFRARGRPGDAVIRSLTIDTWTQVAPISLPRLKRGRNDMRYECGDRYDGVTMPVLVLPNAADPDDLRRHVVEMPRDYDPKRHTARIRGDVVLRLAAPPGAKIAWLSAGATFCTHQRAAAASTANRIAWAAGEPRDFTEVYRSQVPTWAGHWRYNRDLDIRLGEPADVVYVRYTGNPGVSVLRACLHVIPPAAHDPAVRITHGYLLDGRPTERAVEMRGPGAYAIDCEGEVENVFVRIDKPSIR